MKTKLMALLTLIVLGVASQGFAAEKNTLTANEEVAKVVKAKIQFPAFLKAEGVKNAQVLVEFTVNENGTLNVINTNQSDQRVKNYVMEQLENIQVQSADYEVGEVYMLKLNFRLL
ncbi:MAG: hypothetical protein K9I48_09090 [Sphingobacteriales bacterium]|jgi:6-phosphogluconolactonase (cycloisomerase 2 family)|nr:hypothetical protein [Sphingobacteriales bacterium]